MLPVLMLLFALLVQPICVLYTRMVMRHAAAESARVLATATGEDVVESFARRRLKAIPESSLFHVGGSEDWRVQLSRSTDSSSVEVEISGHLRPLPLLGIVAAQMGEWDAQGLLVRERLSERVRPEWLGGDYAQWMEQW